MKTLTLKDERFRVIGYIEAHDDGTQVAKDDHFRVVGSYHPQQDETRDASFRSVGFGNHLAALLPRQ